MIGVERAKLILALDAPVDKATLLSVSPLVHGIKIGLGMTLEMGLGRLRELIKDVEVEEIIVDFKLADIGNIMREVASRLEFADSFIAHSFIGKKGALDELKDFLDGRGKKLYLVGSMSHPGWDDSVNQYTISVIRSVDPHGIVAPATRARVVSKFREEFPTKTIISPGVGTQGASYGEALCHGASFEIVGRSVFSSESPYKALGQIMREQEERVMKCKGTEARE